MPQFSYTARDASGRSVEASIQAPSRKEAVRLLRLRGFQPLRLGEAGVEAAPAPAARDSLSALLRNPMPGLQGRGRPSRRQRLPFLQALSDLTSSGLSAGEGIRLLSLRLREPKLKKLCSELWDSVSEGLPLSRAMEQFPEVFDRSTISLIQAGEATGNLHEILLRLIHHLTEQKETRQKLLTALAYPAFIITVAFGVILFFIFFLLPRLQSMLDSLGGRLPLSTEILIGISTFMVDYGLFVTLGLILGAVGFARWRQTPAGREQSDRLLLKVPLVGPFIISSNILQFSQTLSVLLENGITTAEALRMTERVIDNRRLRAAFSDACVRVLEGESLSLALGKTGYFPDLVIDRLSVGENTGNLVPSLKDIARTFQKTLSYQLQVFTSVVSSGVLLFAFSFVGFVAFAIVSAVFQLSAEFRI